MNVVVQRMKKSVEEDVFIPLYPKRLADLGSLTLLFFQFPLPSP